MIEWPSWGTRHRVGRETFSRWSQASEEGTHESLAGDGPVCRPMGQTDTCHGPLGRAGSTGALLCNRLIFTLVSLMLFTLLSFSFSELKSWLSLELCLSLTVEGGGLAEDGRDLQRQVGRTGGLFLVHAVQGGSSRMCDHFHPHSQLLE